MYSEKILGNNNHTPENQKHWLITPLNTMLEHSYLQFNDQFHKQNKDLAKGTALLNNLSCNIHAIFRAQKNHQNV
jgi:hypothetical protein